MNKACPPYYKITETQDLNDWGSQWLENAHWRSYPEAIGLDILYAEMLRYVIRLPHKGQDAQGVIKDVHKAISLLEDIAEKLAARVMPLQESAGRIDRAQLSARCPICTKTLSLITTPVGEPAYACYNVCDNNRKLHLDGKVCSYWLEYEIVFTR